MNDKEIILKSLQCSICLEFVPEKHLACNSIGRHRTCIMCNDKRAKDKNRCVICEDSINIITDTIVSNIYSLLECNRRCQFSYFGCDEIISQKDYVNHIENCEHRPIRCHNMYCNHLFNSNDNINNHMSHMQIFHGTVVYPEINPHATVNSYYKTLFSYKLNTEKPSLVKISNSLFAIVFVELNSKWNQYVGTAKSEVIVKLCWTNRTSERLDEYRFKLAGQWCVVSKKDKYAVVVPIEYYDNPVLSIEFDTVNDEDDTIETDVVDSDEE